MVRRVVQQLVHHWESHGGARPILDMSYLIRGHNSIEFRFLIIAFTFTNHLHVSDHASCRETNKLNFHCTFEVLIFAFFGLRANSAD